MSRRREFAISNAFTWKVPGSQACFVVAASPAIKFRQAEPTIAWQTNAMPGEFNVAKAATGQSPEQAPEACLVRRFAHDTGGSLG
jgi:hypothetical protein